MNAMNLEQATAQQIEQIGLSETMWKELIGHFGRTPDLVEAGIFAGIRAGRLANLSIEVDLAAKILRSGDFGVTPDLTAKTTIELKPLDIQQPDNLSEVAEQVIKNERVLTHLSTSNDALDTVVVADLSENSKSVLAWGKNYYFEQDAQQSTSVAFLDACRKIVLAGGIPRAIGAVVMLKEIGDAKNQKVLSAVESGIAQVNKVMGLEQTETLVLASSGDAAGVVVVGELPADSKSVSKALKTKGDLIFILGESPEDISGSVYLKDGHGIASTSAPVYDLEKELQLNTVLDGLIQHDLVNSAHACGLGGVYVSLIDMSLVSGLGFDIVTDSEIREDSFLFGESPSRAIVTVSEEQESDFIEFMMNSALSFTLLGHVTKGKLMVDDEHFGFIADVAAWTTQYGKK